MKKLFSIILIMFAFLSVVGAVTFVSDGGIAVTAEEMSGTFSTLTKSNASLKWTCRIKADGNVTFVLKEDGKDVRLSTLPSSTATYNVSIVFSSDSQSYNGSYTGKVEKNGNVFNVVVINLGTDFSEILDNRSMAAVTIKGNNAEYRLGTITLDEVKTILQPTPEGSCGGFIFYDKGFYSDGWRYLEAAPADVRVIDGIPSVDRNAIGYNLAENYYVFGYYRKGAETGNLYVNGSTYYSSYSCTGTAIGTGKLNTELLVKAMGDEAYNSFSGDGVTWFYAAKLCSDLEYEADGKVYDDWFLPSKDELNLMYENCHKLGAGGVANNYYWSSSEHANNSNYAWFQYFYKGNQDYNLNRGVNLRVRPVRAF